MKKSLWILPTVIATLVLLQFFDAREGEAQTEPGNKPLHQFTVNTEPSNSNVLRIGVNLGYRTGYGSEQFIKNLLYNPGFEGDFSRFVVIVTQADQKSFSNEGWEHPDGFWKGADYDIRTGPSAGHRGKITNSLKAGDKGQPQYFADDLPPLTKDDVVILSKEVITPDQPSEWGTTQKTRKGLKMVEDHRPGSPGVTAAELTVLDKDNNSLITYLDTIGGYIKINGGWKLTFWAKSSDPEGGVKVSFKRFNSRPPFIQSEVKLTNEWQKYDLNFVGLDNGQPAALALEFTPAGKAGTKIYLDDLWLGSLEDNSPLSFRKEVVQLLKELHPSYLRDWQVQFVDSFENRVATSFARKNSAPPSSDGVLRNFHWAYSLGEFLDLCQAVGANPWIIVPVTFSDEEYRELGSYLSRAASKNFFPHVILEFGNENWNWIFRAGGIPYAQPHGNTFERAVEMMKSTLKDVNYSFAIGGQLANPWLVGEYTKFAPSADLVNVAGYYIGRINKEASVKNAIASFFSEDRELKQVLEVTKNYKKPLGIYEINAGTVSGTMEESERDQLVAGAISGSFLAKRLLDALFLGIQPDMVFTFSQIDTRLEDVPNGKVKLWGITVDLSPTLRFRPTGLAVKMLNHVIGGEMFNVKRIGSVPLEQLTIATFKKKEGWSMAAVMSNEFPQSVELKFPDDGLPIPSTLWVLDSKNVFDTNEKEENVKIKEVKVQPQGRSFIFTVPPYGLVVGF